MVDLVYFDGASNVQKKAGQILEARYPRITSACAALHTSALFFDNVFHEIDEYKALCNFAKKLGNVFGSNRHVIGSIYKSIARNIGFIKPSDCR